MDAQEKISAYFNDILRLEEEKSRREVALRPQAYSEPAPIAFARRKLLELKWTVQTLAGLGYLHDGSWPPHKLRQALAERPELPQGSASPSPTERIFVDVTATLRHRTHTGIQRVTREIARIVAQTGEAIPVVVSEDRIYSYFRRADLPDEILLKRGDKLVLLDAGWGLCDEYRKLISQARRSDVETIAVIYDIVPLRYPQAAKNDMRAHFEEWFKEIVVRCDAVLCISKVVAEDFIAYTREASLKLEDHFRVGWWRLGSNLSEATATASPSERAQAITNRGAPIFMSVGTIEPRKAYPTALHAFEQLWAEGIDANYVIVGRPGWKSSCLQQRLVEHPQAGKRLHWLENAPDADLIHLYRHARALVFPSVLEGFGLPLVEAAQFGVPVIASDIPIFHEIGGDGVRYFKVLDADDLALRLKEALRTPPSVPNVVTLSWQESAKQLTDLIRNEAYQIPSLRQSSLTR